MTLMRLIAIKYFNHLTALINTYSNGAFPPEGAGLFSPQRCGTGRVSTAKSVRDPDWAVLSQYSSFGVLRRLKGAGEFELHTPSVDRSTESHTYFPRDISGQRRKLCLLKKMSHKSWKSFVMSYIPALCVGLLWDHDAIAIRLKALPMIRVLLAVETWAVRDLGRTAPSLLHQAAPNRPKWWKCAIIHISLFLVSVCIVYYYI